MGREQVCVAVPSECNARWPYDYANCRSFGRAMQRPTSVAINGPVKSYRASVMSAKSSTLFVHSTLLVSVPSVCALDASQCLCECTLCTRTDDPEDQFLLRASCLAEWNQFLRLAKAALQAFPIFDQISPAATKLCFPAVAESAVAAMPNWTSQIRPPLFHSSERVCPNVSTGFKEKFVAVH